MNRHNTTRTRQRTLPTYRRHPFSSSSSGVAVVAFGRLGRRFADEESVTTFAFPFPSTCSTIASYHH